MAIHRTVSHWADFAVQNCRTQYRPHPTKCSWYSNRTLAFNVVALQPHIRLVFDLCLALCRPVLTYIFFSTACGGRLTASNKVKHFYSHAKFGDYDYDNNADCDWTIETTADRNVQLTFLSFNVSKKKTKEIKRNLNLYQLYRLKTKPSVRMITLKCLAVRTTIVAHYSVVIVAVL